jgi:cysteinyl-tRNA synthetase
LQAEDAVSRIDETIGKRNKGDFCLWKFSKAGEPVWQSPFGPGRPGWHIEDTAIAERYFGFQYDIHGGGRDLIFPHHEAEIAQMEALSEKSPMVKYWTHVGFLTVGGTKMSKSLGNFITINNFVKENGGRLLRFFLLKSHYRSPLDYTENNLSQAKKELERIDEFLFKIKNYSAESERKITKNLILKAKKDFNKAMEDDINTPSAIAAIFKLINQTNQLLDQEKLNKSEIKDILGFFKKIDKFFDFIFWKEKKKKSVPEKIKKLVKERERARKNKEWQKADELRAKIEKLGYKLEDAKEETIIKRVSNF